jgi:hypothetical protein
VQKEALQLIVVQSLFSANDSYVRGKHGEVWFDEIVTFRRLQIKFFQNKFLVKLIT